MNDDTLIKVVAVVILAPIAVGAVISVINGGIAVVNAVNNKRYNNKIKKGLKEGRLVEIDGCYYEVVTTNEEA